MLKKPGGLPSRKVGVDSLGVWLPAGTKGMAKGLSPGGCGGSQREAYTLFQNGRHFSILLFTCKLALVASLRENILLNFEFKNEPTRANLQVNKRKLKWRPFWNKEYFAQRLAAYFLCRTTFVSHALKAKWLEASQPDSSKVGE